MRRRWLRTYIFGRGGRDPQVKESKALKASNRWPLRKASTDGAQRNSSNNQRKHFCATQVAKCISQITYVRTYVHNTLLSLYNALHLKTVLSQIDFVKDVHTPGQIWGERKMEWHSAMCGHGEYTCHTGRTQASWMQVRVLYLLLLESTMLLCQLYIFISPVHAQFTKAWHGLDRPPLNLMQQKKAK